MSVRNAVDIRLGRDRPARDEVGRVSLPRTLKSDTSPVRNGLFERLAASRLFALGDRSGVLRSAQTRSGRPFRLDVRQRVIVKALVSRHVGKGAERVAALSRHLAYLARIGAGVEGARGEFFNRDADDLPAPSVTRAWADDRHHFRFIISPEHGDRIADLKRYTREVMRRVGEDLGQPRLQWLAVCHFDTDQPHAHVVIRGRGERGRDLVIPRDYIAYGFRARAQEVAQELLGDLSRMEAERRVWRETQADRFTGLDRRLLAAAEGDGLVDDGVGRTDAWAALTRGRLRRLEALGLAERIGRRYRLDAELEPRLRRLQLDKDIIRTLADRRMAGAREVRALGREAVRGRVVGRGTHDEIGAAPYVVIRDAGGIEHYARLATGAQAPAWDRHVELAPLGRHAAVRELARQADLGL
jgi:type IV secretory pathway VirD2 relaxase